MWQRFTLKLQISVHQSWIHRQQIRLRLFSVIPISSPVYSLFSITLSLRSTPEKPNTVIPLQPFCLRPFALGLCVTATKAAASQCQWPFSHWASPYPGLSQASRRSGTAQMSQGTKGQLLAEHWLYIEGSAAYWKYWIHAIPLFIVQLFQRED